MGMMGRIPTTAVAVMGMSVMSVMGVVGVRVMGRRQVLLGRRRIREGLRGRAMMIMGVMVAVVVLLPPSVASILMILMLILMIGRRRRVHHVMVVMVVLLLLLGGGGGFGGGRHLLVGRVAVPAGGPGQDAQGMLVGPRQGRRGGIVVGLLLGAAPAGELLPLLHQDALAAEGHRRQRSRRVGVAPLAHLEGRQRRQRRRRRYLATVPGSKVRHG